MPILTEIHKSANATFDQAASWLTHFGSVKTVEPLALILVPVLLSQKRWRSLIYLFVTLVGGGTLNKLAKSLWHRARPHVWDGSYPLPSDFSFPILVSQWSCDDQFFTGCNPGNSDLENPLESLRSTTGFYLCRDDWMDAGLSRRALPQRYCSRMDAGAGLGDRHESSGQANVIAL